MHKIDVISLLVIIYVLDSIVRVRYGFDNILIPRREFAIGFSFISTIVFLYLFFKKKIKTNSIENISILILLFLITISFYNSSRTNNILVEYCNNISWILLLFLSFKSYADFEKTKSVFNFIINTISKILFIFGLLSIGSYVLNVYFNIDVTNTYISSLFDNRLIGVYNNPNAAGIMAYVGLMISLYYVSINQSKNFYIFNALVMLVMLLLSSSRTALLSLIVAFLYFVVLYGKKHNLINKKIVIIVGLFFIGVISFVFASRSIPEHLLSGNETDKYDLIIKLVNAMSNGRLYTWIQTVQMANDNILLGHGFGSAYDLSIEYFGDSSNYQLFYIVDGMPHNIFISVYYHLGIFGLISFTVFMVKCFNVIKEIINKDISLIFLTCIPIGIFVFGLLDIAIIIHGTPSAGIFWFTLSYLFTYVYNDKEVKNGK